MARLGISTVDAYHGAMAFDVARPRRGAGRSHVSGSARPRGRPRIRRDRSKRCSPGTDRAWADAAEPELDNPGLDQDSVAAVSITPQSPTSCERCIVLSIPTSAGCGRPSQASPRRLRRTHCGVPRVTPRVTTCTSGTRITCGNAPRVGARETCSSRCRLGRRCRSGMSSPSRRSALGSRARRSRTGRSLPRRTRRWPPASVRWVLRPTAVKVARIPRGSGRSPTATSSRSRRRDSG